MPCVLGQARTNEPVSNYSHDFGNVFHGRPVEHRFDITNTTSSALTVTSSVSAGPFMVSVTNPTIKSGETTEVVCRPSHTLRLSRAYQATITARLTGEKRKERQFSVSANFVPDIRISTSSISFPKLDSDGETNQTLSVFVPKMSNIQFLDVRSKSKTIKARIIDSGNTETENEYKLALQLSGDQSEPPSGEVHLVFQSGSSEFIRTVSFKTKDGSN